MDGRPEDQEKHQPQGTRYIRYCIILLTHRLSLARVDSVLEVNLLTKQRKRLRVMSVCQ